MDPETTSLLSRQPSGIRALPSHDDDDDDIEIDDFDANPDFEIGNSVGEFSKIDGNGKKLSENGTSNGSNESKSSTSSSSGFSSGSNGGLVNGEDVFETPMAADPDEKSFGNLVGLGQNDVGSLVGSGSKARVPVAKVSGEGDDDENEVGSDVEDEEYGVEKVVPKVRVVGEDEDEDEEEDEEWGEPLEGPTVESSDVGEALKVGDGSGGDGLGSGSGEKGSLNSANVDYRGVSLVDEWDEDGDAVVDSIKVDVVEAVRSGVAVVGVEDKESEVEAVDKESEVEAVDKESEVEPKKESEIEPVKEASAGEKSVEVESSVVESTVVAPTNEGDSAVDSSYVDVVKSGSVVAEGEVKKDSEVDTGDTSVADKSALVDTPVADKSASVDTPVAEATGLKYTDEGDAVVDSINVDAAEAVRSGTVVVGELGEARDSGVEVKDSVVEDATPIIEDFVANLQSSENHEAIESDQVKSVGESDSVVDGIQVDVVEAIRSGVAVVGESGPEGVEVEKKEVVAPVGEAVAVANEFAPLAASNSSEVVDVLHDQQKEAQIKEAEVPQSVEITEVLNSEEGNSEPDSGSKECEHAGESQPSVGENEKVQRDHVDDEPDASSVLVEEEKATSRSYASVLVDGLDVAASNKNQLEQTEVEGEDDSLVGQEEVDDEGSDGEADLMYYGSGSSSRKFVEDHGDSGIIDGQVVTDSDEGDSDEEGEGKMLDSAAIAALLKAVGEGRDPGSITVRSQDGSRLFSMDRPVGLEPSLRSGRPATGANNSSFFSPANFAPPVEENLSEEDKKKLETLQHLKVKFLRLVQRVGFTAEHSLAAQVLYKLTVLAGRPVSPTFSLDNAKQTAMQLESEGQDDLDYSLNILVLGKSGVGKSALINSILGEEKVKINAFEPETTSVNEVCGTVDGVKIRFIDAPGLKSSALEQGFNRKVLASVKKLTKKFPPDVMFYVDRLDSQTRDLNDLPLLKTISNSLGSTIWRNAIITLTHASSAPPDGPSGTPLSYEVFVAQRSHIVQQSIGQAVGEMRLMNLNMMNPVSLAENHPACRKNREGQKILPNGQAWRPQLLLLCYSVRILSEAGAASKPQDPFDARKLFGFRTRAPPLPYLLSSLLQPRAHPKLSADQGGDSVDSDIDLDDVSDSDQEEEEDEYDQLPPFKPLKKSQMAKLSGDQKKAYFEEYDYRVKLLQRKQWREELKRMREMKNGKNGMDAYGEMPEDYDGDNGAPAAVPVPLPDMTLPPSFDCDNPAYRYRFLEPTSQFLARPVLDPHGWDHDCGYEGVNIEQNMGIAGRFPAAFTVQVTKDKKDFNIHMDSAVSAKHGENGSSLAGFDVQTIGKQYAYIVRGETKFKNLKKNKTAAGVTVTFLGENVATGLKVEDQIVLGKRLVLVGSTGTVRSQKDAAYGANLEVRLREADYPIGQEQSQFTLSLMKWRGDLAIGANLQSQVSVGRNSKMAVRVALNNKMSGQVTVRTSSSDHLSLALAGLMPIAIAIYRKFRPADVSENYSIY